MKRKPIQFPIEFHNKLKEHCVKRNISMRDYIMFLVEEDWIGFIQSGNTEDTESKLVDKYTQENIISVPRETSVALGIEDLDEFERYYVRNQKQIDNIILIYGYSKEEAIKADMLMGEKLT